jgi:hypothetical protein
MGFGESEPPQRLLAFPFVLFNPPPLSVCTGTPHFDLIDSQFPAMKSCRESLRRRELHPIVKKTMTLEEDSPMRFKVLILRVSIKATYKSRQSRKRIRQKQPFRLLLARHFVRRKLETTKGIGQRFTEYRRYVEPPNLRFRLRPSVAAPGCFVPRSWPRHCFSPKLG